MKTIANYTGAQPEQRGDDGKPLIKLKDQAGRVIFRGSQTEFLEKYGEHLERGTTTSGERRKSRLYLKKQTGGLVTGDFRNKIQNTDELSMSGSSF